MDLYELPFAKIIMLRDDIAEVIVNEGIEMDQIMVDQYHDFLLSHLHNPFSLLINKINSYTYDFYSQRNIGTLKEINTMAVVAYNRTTMISTEMLVKAVPRKTKWDLKIFLNRDEALNWLISQQEKLQGRTK